MPIPLPQSLLDSLVGIPGFELDLFRSVHERGESVSSVRLNAAKTNASRLSLPWDEPVSWCTNGWYLKERPVYTLDPLFHAGCYYVQEASSMFLDHVLRHVLGDRSGLSVIDLCAAPGGKTTLLAALPHFRMVVANELIRSRLTILSENVAKWGLPHVLVSHNDPREVGRLEGFFDVMVVDAPCSGSGLFRRDPEAISEWSERNVQLCSERQQRILADALPALAPDGILIYSTCSYSRQEDEMILDWLVGHEDFEAIPIPANGSWGIAESISAKGAFGYRFFPGKVQGEGLFMACLRRKGGRTFHAARTGKPNLVTTAERKLITPWLKDGDALAMLKKDQDVFLVPEALTADLLQLSSSLQIRKTGIHGGAIGRDEFIPDHELAVSILASTELPGVDLDLDGSREYLRKNKIGPFPDLKGWHLIRHEGIGLGWAKMLSNRVNNYYPASWRILNL